MFKGFFVVLSGVGKFFMCWYFFRGFFDVMERCVVGIYYCVYIVGGVYWVG